MRADVWNDNVCLRIKRLWVQEDIRADVWNDKEEKYFLFSFLRRKECLAMKTFFVNGTVLTMTGETARAVAVADGRVVYAGDEAGARAYMKDAQTVDLKGKTLLPAFIDSHSHLSAVANSLLEASVQDADSVEDLRARVRRFIADNRVQQGQWISAAGYMPEHLAEKRAPTLQELDAICPGHPLVVKHQSGHSGLFNSAALQQLGVTPATVSPSGGLIEKRDGRLTGFMEENAFISYVQKTPMPHIRQLMGAFSRAQDVYFSHGITTVQEGMLVQQLLPLYKHLSDAGALKADVVAYADMACADAARESFAAHAYTRGLRLGGYKIFLDGSPQGRTAYMRAPYADAADGYRGYGVMTDEAVLEAVRKAGRDEMQLLAHCNGDAAAQQFLAAVRTAERELPQISRLRDVIIHAQLLSIDQLDEVKALSLIPSFFVAHVYHFGDVHIKNFGFERAQWISPAASALARGIPFTFHQDSPVIPPDMLETIWCACARTTKEGVALGESERLPVYEALKAVTVNAAYQYGEEKDKGSIEPGKRADFCVLSENPLAVPVDALKNIRVLATYKHGEAVYSE